MSVNEERREYLNLMNRYLTHCNNTTEIISSAMSILSREQIFLNTLFNDLNNLNNVNNVNNVNNIRTTRYIPNIIIQNETSQNDTSLNCINLHSEVAVSDISNNEIKTNNTNNITDTSNNISDIENIIKDKVLYCQYCNIENPINTVCPISGEEFNNDDDIIKILHCNHLVGKENLLKWFKTSISCPMCKYNIEYDKYNESIQSLQDSSSNNFSQILENDITNLLRNSQRLSIQYAILPYERNRSLTGANNIRGYQRTTFNNNR